MQPYQGNLKGMIEIFVYLKKFYKGKILIDPNYPDHAKFQTPEYDQWQKLYPDVQELVPDKSETLPSKSKSVCITVYKDADYAYGILTKRLVSGILIFINNTPVKWVYKHQKTVETSTYGSELVGANCKASS